MKKIDKYKYGAKEVCMVCKQAISFYPADGKTRVAKPILCPDCTKATKKLMIQMGKPQYWTKKE